MYDKKQLKFRAEQVKIKNKMDSLQKADEEYYITASYILSLANRAYDLFKSSEPDIKRQLLKLVLQNCEIKDASLTYKLITPSLLSLITLIVINGSPYMTCFDT